MRQQYSLISVYVLTCGLLISTPGWKVIRSLELAIKGKPSPSELEGRVCTLLILLPKLIKSHISYAVECLCLIIFQQLSDWYVSVFICFQKTIRKRLCVSLYRLLCLSGFYRINGEAKLNSPHVQGFSDSLSIPQ